MKSSELFYWFTLIRCHLVCNLLSSGVFRVCSGLFPCFSCTNDLTLEKSVLSLALCVFDIWPSSLLSLIEWLFSGPPQRCVLCCCWPACWHCGLFQAQHAQKKTDQALITLGRAIANDPRNSLCKFHKASILLACDRHKVSSNFVLFLFMQWEWIVRHGECDGFFRDWFSGNKFLKGGGGGRAVWYGEEL